MGIFSAKDSVKLATGKANRQARQAQTKNQVQAAQSAGRGRRSVGGGGSSRARPSRTF